MPTDRWKTDLRMRDMGKDFAKGAFFALKSFNGGGILYRLVKQEDDGSYTELDRYGTGNIRVNS